MPDGTDTVTTEQGSVVDAGANHVTEVTMPAASTTTPAPSVSVPVPTPRSDDQARIRTLQSEWEKAKAQRDQLTIEKAGLLSQIDALKLERSNELAINAEATRNAIAKSDQFERENATLRAEVTRLKYVIERPHLMPYLKLMPETDDPQKLAEADEAITQAHTKYAETVNERVRAGAAVPPASPARPSGTLDSTEMNRQLAEARQKGDSVAFNRLVEELAAKIPKS